MVDSPTLYIVPSSLEYDLAAARLKLSPVDRLERCGVGLVAAAVRTMQLIGRNEPGRVVLLGMAGGYGETEVGSAIRFSRVGLWGVGAGEESDLQSLTEMGLDDEMGLDNGPEEGCRVDCLSLDHGAREGQLLLTVCAAAAGPRQVAWRRKRFPAAVAEDMEGYAVAAACQLAGVPLQIIRGISNRAGNRNHAEWQMESAMVNCINAVRMDESGDGE